MVLRPTQTRRDWVAQEACEVAGGTLEPEHAGMSQLFPDSMLAATDEVLEAFEVDVAGLGQPTDSDVFASVERVVLALNAVNDRFGQAAYDAGQRDQLCSYIDAVLSEGGIDVPTLAARNGMGPYDITDQWRSWKGPQ